MEHKIDYLELNIISAEDLERKWLSGDQTVAVAWLDPSAKKTSSIVGRNGSSVQWNEKLILTLNGVDTSLQSKLLTVEIHARGAWGDSLLGSVYVPLVELIWDGDKRGNTIFMYEIVQPSGKRQGSVKFLAKVVKPRVSGSVVRLPSSLPILPLEDDGNGLGSNALYPPANAMCPVEIDDERFSSEADLRYPILEGCSYPPQCCFSENYAAGQHDAGQQDRLPDPSYAYPPQVYPPVYTAYPTYTSLPHSPYSNYTGMKPYPSASLPGLETPYLPPAYVYPPPTLFSEARYPPIASHPPYPPIAPHPPETYPQPSFNAYSGSLYPPPYPLQQPIFLYPYPSH